MIRLFAAHGDTSSTDGIYLLPLERLLAIFAILDKGKKWVVNTPSGQAGPKLSRNILILRVKDERYPGVEHYLFYGQFNLTTGMLEVYEHANETKQTLHDPNSPLVVYIPLLPPK